MRCRRVDREAAGRIAALFLGDEDRPEAGAAIKSVSTGDENALSGGT